MPEDYWQLILPAWDSLVQWDEIPAFEAAFASTAVPARTLFAAHWLQSEVCNGGFHQFYWNSTGILAPEAADAFIAIGMVRTAEVIRQSVSWFPTPYPRSRAIRIGLLDAYDETDPEAEGPFQGLDDEFYALIESESGGFEHAANGFAKQQS